jgi:hypothetical protein
MLFTDIKPSAGGTYVCEDGLTEMIKWLYNHPEGTNMRDGPDGSTAYDVIKQCNIFTEVSASEHHSYPTILS